MASKQGFLYDPESQIVIYSNKRLPDGRVEVVIEISDNIAKPVPSAVKYMKELTKRENEVGQLIALGLQNKHIASKLNLQEQSIKNLVSSIMRKLGCKNRVQIALFFYGVKRPREFVPTIF
ncbi:response regulator transcription factor [Candidatus Berkelbacteria bacterium]|nr:response regulator transcription factor [Candidatus Berkelbacteria bacterium]